MASKPMTEQYILSEIMKQLIEARLPHLRVDLTKGIAGGTSNIHPALVSGDIDIYPEYTGTGWLFVLKENEIIGDRGEFVSRLTRQYEDKYHATWTGFFGFQNTFCILVRSDIARTHNLVTISDLARVSDRLQFGAEPDFYVRDDGMKGLSEAYDLHFPKSHQLTIDIALKYQALEQGRVDCIIANSTDAQIAALDVTSLEDDKHYFVNYEAACVVREDLIRAHPELTQVLEALNQSISQSDMIKMNYALEHDKKNEHEIARDFLRAKGLVSQ